MKGQTIQLVSYEHEHHNSTSSVIMFYMCADIFENISQTVKKEKYKPEADTLRVRERDRSADCVQMHT